MTTDPLTTLANELINGITVNVDYVGQHLDGAPPLVIAQTLVSLDRLRADADRLAQAVVAAQASKAGALDGGRDR